MRASTSSTAHVPPAELSCSSRPSVMGSIAQVRSTVPVSAMSTSRTTPVIGVNANSLPAGSTEIRASAPNESSGSASASKSTKSSTGEVHTSPCETTTTFDPARVTVG